MKTPDPNDAAIQFAQRETRNWFLDALSCGAAYYLRQGANVELATIRNDEQGARLVNLWPECGPHAARDAALVAVAKAMGFNFERRCFVVGGAQHDPVLHLLCNLARWCGVVAPEGCGGAKGDDFVALLRRKNMSRRN